MRDDCPIDWLVSGSPDREVADTGGLTGVCETPGGLEGVSTIAEDFEGSDAVGELTETGENVVDVSVACVTPSV